MSERLLDVKDLRVSFFTPNGEVKAVGGVSYHVDKEEVVAIVGESGCGKSVTQMSVMQLIQMPPGKILGGEVIFEGKNLLVTARNQRDACRARCRDLDDLSGTDDQPEPCVYRRAAADRSDPHPHECLQERGLETGHRGAAGRRNP